MPVLLKKTYEQLEAQRRNRIEVLFDALESRPLKSSREGIKGRGSWAEPENFCATKATNSELRIAIDDFKTILSELRKLK